MRGTLRTAALALGVVLTAGGSRAAEQEAINKAIDRGVAALKQLQGRDGKWPHAEIGATALAGLALLECKVPADDPAVDKAAAAVRQESVRLTHTYSISLAILFLDRLGDARDVPLIESLTVRLLAGQSGTGGWTYQCPPIAASEVRRLEGLLQRRNELKAGQGLPGRGKRTVRDLPREIQQQVAMVNRAVAMPAPGDNSNTQFATMALWVARRHGLPVDLALRRIEARYRLSQNNDGGWSYTQPMMGRAMRGRPPGAPLPGMMGSTMAMTCAGLLGLAAGHGARGDRALGNDRALKFGLLALGTAIGEPPRQVGRPGFGPRVGPANGRVFYALWSLERVAVALGLDTIGKKNWYNWGADLLLGSQQADGSWRADYGASGVDTCFALLFLKRANLTSDLTASLGKVKDPGEAELRGGGVGGAGLTARRPGIKHALAPEDKENRVEQAPADAKKLKPIPVEVENTAASKLSNALVEATGAEQDEVLKKLRDSKGVDYTEALLLALPRLDDSARKKAREALKQRFTRLTAKSLFNYLKDTDPEVRRAAALASAEKDLRQHIPVIIDKLSDPEPSVVRAAHVALKALTAKDFGPAADATAEETDKAIAAWKAWWRNKGKE
jgi:HEAT repeat protein